MRRRHTFRRIAAGLAGLLLLLFAALQTEEGQRALFGLAASAASDDARTVRLEGPSGFFPTDLALRRVEVADRQGVWLSATDVHFSWSILALLRGRLDVQSLRAASVALERTPQRPAQPARVGAGEDDGRLALSVSVDSLAIDELRLGAQLAGVDSRWRIAARARLDGMEGANSLTLDATRRDGGSGRLSLRAAYDGPRRTLSATGEFEEGEGGVLAALLGRPDLPRTAGRFEAEIAGREGQGRISVEAGDALRINGTARARAEGAGHRAALAMSLEGGHMPDPVWAAALAEPVTIEADIVLEAAGAIEVRSLQLKASPLAATASGRYVPSEKRLQLKLAATGGDAAMLTALVPGAGWRDLRVDLQASGTLAAIDATLALRAAELTLPDAAARDVDLSTAVRGADVAASVIARAELKGTLGAVTWRADGREMSARDVRPVAVGQRDRAGNMSLSSFELISSLGSARGLGRLAADGAVDATVALDLPDLSVLNALRDQAIAGAGQATLQVTGTRARPLLALDATVRDAAVPGLPPSLLAGQLRATANVAIEPGGRWRLERATLASDALSLTASGTGIGANGALDATISLPRLEALDPRTSGSLRGDIHVEASDARRSIRLRAEMAQATFDRAAAERLSLDAGLVLRADGLDATLQLDGSSFGQPLRANGRISATTGERLMIPSFDASLGSTRLVIRDLAVDRGTAHGTARLLVEDLKELGAMTGQNLAGRLEIDIVPDPAAGDGRLKLSLRGTGLARGETGAGTLGAEGTIADPLGRATFDVAIKAGALRGVAGLATMSLKLSGDRDAIAATAEAAGPGLGVNGAIKARRDGDAMVVDIDSLRGTFGGRPFALAGPARLRQAGGRITVDALRLNISGGQVRLAGTIDETDSALTVDVAPLPLAELAALAGLELPLDGTVQAQIAIRGARDNPQVDASWTARDMRLRRIAMASVPAMSLTGKGTLRDRAIAAEARLSVAASTLAIIGSGQLPRQGGAAAGKLTLNGTVDLAILASLLGPTIQQLSGRAVVDAAVTLGTGRAVGSGTVRLQDVKLSLPAQGLVLSQGSGLVRLAGEQVVIERLAFPGVGKGDIELSGEVRLDPKVPMELRVETRNARLLARRDLMAELTSSLRLGGSVAEGLSLQGQIRIDRAEINAAVGGGAKSVPSVPVREIGAGAPKKGGSAAPARPLTLDLKVSAPGRVHVRGQGLDAEVAGELTVSGASAHPSVVGGLNVRRGNYTLLGRKLDFSRGTVTFTDPERIVPILDLVATSRGSSVTVLVKVTGPASEPKIELTSSPPLPQDEIIAQLLFGKGATQLGPGELVQVASAVAELSGVGPSASPLGFVKRTLGLDFLGSGGGNVQIEILPRVKLEAEIGLTSTGRVGIAWEYEY